jgi:DNA-binding transcriptional LysR family regulator
MKKLENSVNIKLIDKKGKKIFLTAAGQELYKTCETIFYEIERAQDQLGYYQEKLHWNIEFGAPVEFGTTILIPHMKTFLENNPHITVHCLFSNHLHGYFLRDRVDFIIDCKDHSQPNTEKIFLFQEDYVTIAAPAFIETHNIRQIEDLKRVAILSLDKELLWWKNFLIAILPEQQESLQNVMQITHVRGLINGAIHGLGVSFVPRYTVMNELNEGILMNPFPHIRPAADDFCIFIKRKKLKIEKNRLFIDYLTQIKPVEFGAGG